MTHWLIPANTKFYDVIEAFHEPETYWPVNSKVSAGDFAYIYLAAPYQQIAFVAEILEVNLDAQSAFDHVKPFFKGEIENTKPNKSFMRLKTTSIIPLEGQEALSYSKLKANGLNGMLMGARKLENNPQLFEYIQGNIP